METKRAGRDWHRYVIPITQLGIPGLGRVRVCFHHPVNTPTPSMGRAGFLVFFLIFSFILFFQLPLLQPCNCAPPSLPTDMATPGPITNGYDGDDMWQRQDMLMLCSILLSY